MNEKCGINFSNKIVMRKQKKRRKTQSFNGVNSGDPAGIRTPDTLLKRQVLCRLSYWIKKYGVGKGTRTLDPRNHNPML